MKEKDLTKFNNWLNDKISKTGKQFPIGFYIETKKGELLFSGTHEYKEWYNSNIEEFYNIKEPSENLIILFNKMNEYPNTHPVDIIKNTFINPPTQPSFNANNLEIRWRIVNGKYDFYVYNKTIEPYSEFFKCTHEAIVKVLFI